MPNEKTDEEKLSNILMRDDRYRREAYRFVQESLEFTVRRRGRRGHVTGPELAEGLRDLARDRFGLLAKTVLNQWGITCTRDIGELVFNMVEESLMVKQESDSREDFEKVYDFEVAFDKDFPIEMEGQG